jgi:cation-transporting ATPase E
MNPSPNLPNSVAHQIEGLTESEAAARHERGQGNVVKFQTSRSYFEILRKNAFTFINSILFFIGFVLILMGQYGDALVTAGLVLLNVIAGVVQESRAKHKLDQIALLARPKATVVRSGMEVSLDPDQVVLGDVLVIRPGNQFVVDGVIISGGPIEVDESLLTGESERIRKGPGDAVLSGSFCVTGSAAYEAEKVGAESFVNQLTAGARVFRQIKTPLQKDIDYIIRILVVLVATLGILLGISFGTQGLPLVEGLRIAAVIVALVPQGLFFMTTVAYGMGALRVAGKGALIREVNAVESTSNVNLLCLDKTGTLTTNRIMLQEIRFLGEPLGWGEDRLESILGDYASNMPAGNRTIEAISQVCEGQRRIVEEAVPFSSERRWSALAFDDPALKGVFVLGSLEVLDPMIEPHPDRDSLAAQWAGGGLRVLLFAYRPASPLHDARGEPQLPTGLKPLGLLGFSDELRPEVGATLEHFAQLGVELKIISGDNPATVAALSVQAGFTGDIRVLSGMELDAIDGTLLEETARVTNIFGRITPQQKEKLVRLFRKMGYYVAMIGDGVNDVLSLKGAHLGVAMQSGSQAARSVADIVLMGDSFAALPHAFREGQRIVKGMEDIIRLLLTRTIYVLLLVITTQFVSTPFPVTPKHNSILALLTVGIPILAIAAWARPGKTPRGVLESTIGFVFPAAITIAVVALTVFLVFLGRMGDVGQARTALTTVMLLCGLVLILFVEPPTKAWVAGDELSGDWRPTILSLGMLVLFGVVMAVPSMRSFFELVPLRLIDYLVIGVVVMVWALFLRFSWRGQLFERLLGRETVESGS